MIEQKLIDRIIRKGDRAAGNELVGMYYKPIYIYVYKQTSDKELSMDLTQEIFISVLKSLSSYDSQKSSFKTWIYKIASFKVIDYYRSKHYKYSNVTEYIDDQLLYDKSDMEYEFEVKEDILSIVNSMKAQNQQIFRLKAFGELTFLEISTLLDISESTVKTRYYAILRKVRQELKEGYDAR